MKKVIIAIIVIILIAVAAFLITRDMRDTTLPVDMPATTTPATTTPITPVEPSAQNEAETVIGTSVSGNPITAYHYGSGDDEILLVGGIHGGYSWNTALVAYEAMDYFDENENDIPDNVRVTVIPVLNPDGLKMIAGTAGRFEASAIPSSTDTTPGRFNGNAVDLNRNFDCDWQASGKWQDKTVNAGSKAFSEPESAAVRDYINNNTPSAVVVWYSSAGGVYASNCHDGILSETREIMNAYAKASGYTAHDSFDFYAITGDMTNWLAKMKIPSISVLLTNHTSTEWTKNEAGIKALLEHYAD